MTNQQIQIVRKITNAIINLTEALDFMVESPPLLNLTTVRLHSAERHIIETNPLIENERKLEHKQH